MDEKYDEHISNVAEPTDLDQENKENTDPVVRHHPSKASLFRILHSTLCVFNPPLSLLAANSNYRS